MGRSLVVALLFLASVSFSDAATYFVRTDGGTSEHCNGSSDAAYPGAGSNQPCAWSHPFWALDGNGAWKIKGSDTLIIGAGSYMIGFGAPNTGWCSSDSAWDCALPPLPSGTGTSTPTRFLGQGWDSGCASPPELWGTERTSQVLSLQNTSHVLIDCLELTDHSGCVESHSNSSVACQRDQYPYGTWAPNGIFAADSSDVVLRNLNIHGFAGQGLQTGRLSGWTVDNVRIAANGWAGWNGDLGENSSNSGTMSFNRWTVEWNGCAETWPGRQPDHCWDQSAGGYGDGVGTAATGGHWVIHDSVFRYNTSDGLDLLYVGRNSDGQGTSVEVSRTMAYGNAGNPIKISGPSTVTNSVIVGNCGFFSGKPFAQEVTDHCRAYGDALAINVYRGNEVAVVNNTIVGHGDVLVEIECDGSSNCNGTEQVKVLNNILLGSPQFPPGSDDQTAFLWDPSNMTRGNIDYNVIYNVKDSDLCPFGPHDLCQDPLFADSSLEHFKGYLLPGSPGIDSGLSPSANGGMVPSDDFTAASRPLGKGYDRGAYEYGTCSGLLSDDLSFHLPVVSVGNKSYMADFRYDKNLDFALTNAAEVTDTSAFSTCMPSTLSPDFTLHISSIILNGIPFWVDMKYVTGLTFSFLGAGTAQLTTVK